MKRLSIFTLILALAATACQEDYIGNDIAVSDQMRFHLLAPGVQTKVASDTFEVGDKIGLYVTDYINDLTPMPLQISGNRASNISSSFSGSAWTPAKPIYWGTGKSDVYAYYPYISNITDVLDQHFSVALDQNTAKTSEVLGGYEASDFLWGKADGVSQAGGPVNIQMNHVMSKLIVKIVAGKDYKGSLPDDASVLLHSTVADARLNLSNGSVVKDPYSGVKSIKMKKLGLRSFGGVDAVVYEAIVVPQMLETIVPLLEINSKSVSYLLEESFNFRPGVVYTYTATLNTSTTAIKVQIGCELEDWNSIGGGDTGSGGGSGGDTGGSQGGGVDISLYEDLSATGTANCYLISKAGKYRFPAVLGNTSGSVGNVKKVEVLWESFGTDVTPNIGDLVTNASYSNGFICFETPAIFKNGNAVIAAKNSKGTILWSWHIWCSEEGWKEQIYFNNAGTMMDRNLGATTAQSNTVGALGLLYQWGRKDPFLGSSSTTSAVEAASTGIWSHSTKVDPVPNIAETNPMTYYSNLTMPDYAWSSKKTAYDPCPAGWRVPDGGPKGVWATALGNSDNFVSNSLKDGNVLNFTGKFGADPMIIYPIASTRYPNGNLYFDSGQYWSCTPWPYSNNKFVLCFDYTTYPDYTNTSNSCAISVRCMKE